jgi:two-component system LytT family response regulator
LFSFERQAIISGYVSGPLSGDGYSPFSDQKWFRKRAPTMDLCEDSDSPQVADLQEDTIDYLLKPCAKERVHEVPNIPFQRTLETRLSMSPKLAIKMKRRILFIDPTEIAVVEAEGKYVLLRRNSETCLLRQSISTIADKLKPYGFIRIHRSVLVNTSFVEEIRPRNSGEYVLRIKDGNEYTVSRTYKNNLRSIAHSWIGTDSFIAN